MSGSRAQRASFSKSVIKLHTQRSRSILKRKGGSYTGYISNDTAERSSRGSSFLEQISRIAAKKAYRFRALVLSRGYHDWKADLFDEVMHDKEESALLAFLGDDLLAAGYALVILLFPEEYTDNELLYAYNFLRDLRRVPLASRAEIDPMWINGENTRLLKELIRKNLEFQKTPLKQEIFLLNIVFQPHCLSGYLGHVALDKKPYLAGMIKLLAYNDLRARHNEALAVSVDGIDNSWLQAGLFNF